jgi:predicted membrane protein (TIGR00267 family)
MKVAWRTIRKKVLLAATMGLTDGILTALTLAAGLLTSNKASVTVGLALRVAGGASISGAFVYFVAKYAEFRQELVHAELQLSLLAHGKLALTHLGNTVLREAGFTTLVSSGAAFLGALCPLLVATAFSRHQWTSLVAAHVALGLLGIALARALYGSVLRWSLALIVGGVLLTAIGIRLAIL